MQHTKEITLDFSGPNYFGYITAVQGDAKSRYLKITILQNNLKYTPPSQARAIFKAHKPDNTYIINDAIIDTDGTIIVELTAQTLAAVGVIKCNITLFDSLGSAITTIPFFVKTLASLTSPNLNSQNEYIALINALSDIYALSEAVNNHTSTTVSDTVIGVHGLRYFNGDLQYYDTLLQEWKTALRKDEMLMMSKNYDTNATDLTIPGCVEYVKDSLYCLSKQYLYPNTSLNYNTSTQRYSTAPDTAAHQSTGTPYALQVIEGAEVQNATLRHLIIEQGVKQIGYKSFRGQSNLDRVDFAESLEWVHPDAFYGTAWYDNQPLGEVYCSKVLYEYKAQKSQSSVPYVLKKNIIVRPGTKSISSNAFCERPYDNNNLWGLRSITLPAGLIGIGDYAFAGVKYVGDIATIINIPDTVTWIGKYAFAWTRCKNLVLPPNIERIQAYSFYGCDFSDDILAISSSVKIVENAAFYDAKISEITFNNGVEIIGPLAFANNDIVTLSLPDGVQTIANEAFGNNAELTSVTLPSTITHIGTSVFGNCTAITDITIGNSFAANQLDISDSPDVTVSSLTGIIDNLADKTDLAPGRLIVGADNLAKIPQNYITIATNKNWTLS